MVNLPEVIDSVLSLDIPIKQITDFKDQEPRNHTCNWPGCHPWVSAAVISFDHKISSIDGGSLLAASCKDNSAFNTPPPSWETYNPYNSYNPHWMMAGKR